MNKILVVGGSYFIGKKIVDVLLSNGYKVFTLNRGSKPVPEGVTNIVCDRNDTENMSKVLKGLDFSYIIDVSGLNETQAKILYNSVEQKNLKSFVFISSSSVYDIENLLMPFKETDKLKENIYWADYGKKKIEAEEYYIQKFTESNANLIILRPPYVYGENNYAQRESFIFDHLLSNRPIILPKSNTKLQFIYTADLANIIITLITMKLPKISIYNVGNKDFITAEKWIECCAQAAQFNCTKIIMYDYKADGRNVRDFFPFPDYDNVLDVTKINLIYNTETEFVKGLHKSFEWFLNNRNNIVFKEHISQNEKAILKSMCVF